MSLLEKLKAGKNNVKIISWPGIPDGNRGQAAEKAEKVGLIVLTESEKLQAAFETEKKFKVAGIDFNYGTADAYQSEQNTQVLALSLVDPEKKTPLFKNADELRPLLVSGVKSILVDEVNSWQEECSPSLEQMTDQKYQELFESIKKNPLMLRGSSSNTLKGLITYLANRPATSPTDSGSTST